MSLLAVGGRLAVVTTRRPEAATVKAFMRSRENPHPLLESASSAQRLSELYPLLQADTPFAVVQASEPLWPSSALGQRGPRSLACHVLQRTRRRQPQDQEGGDARLPARGAAQLFSQPRPLPFGGGA
ncbi:unnamed protein product [Prorocentrum cordatum]|uniref:Uncharacterized protein n=1 Tax=Prorocentrum cordatum TaxID=2364126 RepID=A0ABN9RGJ1_9DINO|nr:unnamed protein product [Polarella glacialis]